jgi:tetratricopeptide (TPR) repeat protein
MLIYAVSQISKDPKKAIKQFNETVSKDEDKKDIQQQYRFPSMEDSGYNDANKKYYDGLQKMESDYSVLYNMGLIDGSEVEVFISQCKQNILDYKTLKKYWIKYNEEIPPVMSAYKRLAMIYEKQGEYKKAIEVCKEAIDEGCNNDGSKGMMEGRLARLERKLGFK